MPISMVQIVVVALIRQTRTDDSKRQWLVYELFDRVGDERRGVKQPPERII